MSPHPAPSRLLARIAGFQGTVFTVFGFLFGVLIARAPAESPSADEERVAMRVEPGAPPMPHANLKITEVRESTTAE